MTPIVSELGRKKSAGCGNGLWRSVHPMLRKTEASVEGHSSPFPLHADGREAKGSKKMTMSVVSQEELKKTRVRFPPGPLIFEHASGMSRENSYIGFSRLSSSTQGEALYLNDSCGFDCH